MSGANVKGAVNASIGAGGCGNLDLSIPGAKIGDAVAFSTNGTVPAKVIFVGVGVYVDNQVRVIMCNFGASSASVPNLPVHVVTFNSSKRPRMVRLATEPHLRAAFACHRAEAIAVLIG